MSIESVIEIFCSRDLKKREHDENDETTANTECSRCSPCSHLLADHEKKARLRELIKQVSKNYGGDAPIFLAKYIDDVIQEWSHNLDAALTCIYNISIQRVK